VLLSRTEKFSTGESQDHDELGGSTSDWGADFSVQGRLSGIKTMIQTIYLTWP
jgi:hypothetical protein